MKKLGHSFFLAILTLFSGFAAYAAPSGNWEDDQNRDASWTPDFAGGATNTIVTAGQLAQFAYLVNQGNTFSNTVVCLTESVDLAEHYWTPAGWRTYDRSRYSPFSGTFVAADGVMIDGLIIDDASLDCAGLFGHIGFGGEVRSLTLTNVNIKARMSVGAIAGESCSPIRDCAIYGMVQGDAQVGGIVGLFDLYTVANCASGGSVQGTVYIGGIVGFNHNGTVVNSVNRGTITGQSSVGGIMGYGDYVFNCVNDGAVSGEHSVGGISGDGQRLENCVNHGAVHGNFPVGAIAGTAYGEMLSNCFWNAETSGQTVAVAETGAWTTIANCVSFGAAPGDFADPVSVGGVSTRSLITALNAWVDTAPPGDTEYLCWVFDASSDGYPCLATARGNWAEEPNRDTGWLYSTAPGAVNTITTASQLAQLAWLVNDGHVFAGTTNRITASIDLSAHFWTPIATRYGSFKGTLTAAPGAVIDGLTIADVSLNNAGLIGRLDYGGVADAIVLTNTAIFARQFVGAIVGITFGTVYNGMNHGIVEGYSSVGGIAGATSDFGGIATNNINHGIVRGSLSCIGGIVGENCGGIVVNGNNYGKIGGFGHYVGGIVGISNHGSVMASINHGAVGGDSFAGGIVGLGHGFYTVANCANHGAVKSADYAGGIIAQNSMGTTENCFNRGFVEGITTGGGIVGINMSATVVNCVNYGKVKDAIHAGGIAGWNEYALIERCYWNAVINEQLEAVGCAIGTVIDCAPFDTAPGTLSAPVAIGGISTSDLLTVLNAWITASASAYLVTYLGWTHEGSPDGYPVLGDAVTPLVLVSPGDIAEVGAAGGRFSSIRLPRGGIHYAGGMVTDTSGKLVYRPQQNGVMITGIDMDGDAAKLFFDSAERVVVFGKTALDDKTWEYLNDSDTVSLEDGTATVTAEKEASPLRFFTLRKGE